MYTMQSLLPVCQAGFTLITDGRRGEGEFLSIILSMKSSFVRLQRKLYTELSWIVDSPFTSYVFLPIFSKYNAYFYPV